MYKQEAQMYKPVMAWLKSYLLTRHPGYRVSVHNTSRQRLEALIRDEGLQKAFPQYASYEFMVDITGILKRGKVVKLAFVECKLKDITLSDIGQLLAYSIVAQPAYAFILSPADLSSGLSQLLKVHQRYEVLDYGAGRIKVARWDAQRQEIISASLLPPGEHS